MEIDPDVPHQFVGDEKKIRQVLLNLLSNALKFTHQGYIGVRICLYPDNDKPCLEFIVEDTGEGIAAHELPKLFVPFEQTGSGAKSKTGTGLGLSISQQFVRLMGGEFQVISQLGQGTVFSFTVQSQNTVEELETSTSATELEPVTQGRDTAPEATSSKLSTVTNSPVSSIAITQALATMSSDWLMSLKQASQRLNGRQVMKLLSQMPDSELTVANHLKELAENYDYGQLTALLSDDPG